MKVSRRREMQVLQKEYQLDVKIPGLPAQVKVLPEDETFSWHYFLDVLLSKLAEYGIESHKLTKKGKRKEWKNVDDVKTVYTKAFGVPQSSKYFNDDMKFGRQRISCLNSLLIEMCTAIPENFAATENMIKPFLEGKTIKQAIKDKKAVHDKLGNIGRLSTRTENLMSSTCIVDKTWRYHRQDFNAGIEGVFHIMGKSDNILINTASESSLAADFELQNWGAELVKSRDDGGVGILGVPGNGNFKTTEQLVITLTAIIYTCSAGHATANFEQYDEYGAPFNYPFHLSGNPPTDKTMSITKVLSDKATDSLGHFEKQFIVDPHAVQIVEEFRQKLQEVGKTIDERNQKREYPYEWLRPQAVPNAISI
ncbi:ALOX5 [Mytilus edulis]|uniref:ALOX5 n=1 Tax=Mytilus edulis TaxID=6550 RepID=A0A8S3RBK4_MYTED|nr:ALOX5 [Mytilus edulis]